MEHDVEIKMIADVSDLKKQVANITGDMKGLEKQIGKTGKATTFSAVTQGLQMVEKYGKTWAFQYSSKEWEEWKHRRPQYIPIETELEVIE